MCSSEQLRRASEREAVSASLFELDAGRWQRVTAARRAQLHREQYRDATEAVSPEEFVEAHDYPAEAVEGADTTAAAEAEAAAGAAASSGAAAEASPEPEPKTRRVRKTTDAAATPPLSSDSSGDSSL